MNDETKNVKVPTLRSHGIKTWIKEFKGSIMGYKGAHLVLKDDRPEEDEERLAELAGNTVHQQAKLKSYKDEIKNAQEKWDERNDIVCARLLDSVRDNENSEARLMIYAGIKESKNSQTNL
jgi:hypothetical protein